MDENLDHDDQRSIVRWSFLKVVVNLLAIMLNIVAWVILSLK
jgi:hypothetical protein